MTEETTTTTPSFDSFKEAMPETTREAFEKNGVSDFESLDKHYTNMNAMIGKKGLIRPEEGAGEEAMGEYNKSLFKEMGVPEDGAYTFDIPESWTEGSGITQGLMDNLAKLGLEKGISNDAFQGIVDTLGETVGKMTEQAAETFGTEEGLKGEWGDEFKANSDKAEAFIDSVSPESKALLQLPAFKKFALDMAARSGDDVMNSGNTSNVSREGLQAELDELTAEAITLRGEGKFKLMDSVSARRQAILQKLA